MAKHIKFNIDDLNIDVYNNFDADSLIKQIAKVKSKYEQSTENDKEKTYANNIIEIFKNIKNIKNWQSVILVIADVYYKCPYLSDVELTLFEKPSLPIKNYIPNMFKNESLYTFLSYYVHNERELLKIIVDDSKSVSNVTKVKIASMISILICNILPFDLINNTPKNAVKLRLIDIINR